MKEDGVNLIDRNVRRNVAVRMAAQTVCDRPATHAAPGFETAKRIFVARPSPATANSGKGQGGVGNEACRRVHMHGFHRARPGSTPGPSALSIATVCDAFDATISMTSSRMAITATVATLGW